MTRINKKFMSLKEDKKKALIPFIMAGDPDIDTTIKLVLELEKAGADIIELGLPYSDPLADGPVLQRSAKKAIEKGMDMDQYLKLIESIRKKTEVPLVGLVYVNSLLQYGWDDFGKCAEKAGLDGVIIPDLPKEARFYDGYALSPLPITEIRLVAPTSGERVRTIAKDADGFLYCIASKGVTGARNTLDEGLKTFMTQVRQETNCPTALGFGISSPEMVMEIRELADGFIIGSSLMEKLDEDVKSNKGFVKTIDFIATLREALDKNR
ncbi:tryptophan synthase, alpha chain [Tindallia magadiensis]|uniref:Tryptophan synthase alpha chain n=1 Tax=Tindallia magadiensis TaxID=69895 RepID=A0A1I3B045_9FIRM|nr:tryptophan synthase subunit alpha [Tindallia magadiensis]SFH55446.1 tryptophan synthase, alpha chain [Tindallia magadiensis]